MKTERNQKKKYGPLLGLLILNWLALGWVVWRVDPESIKNFIVPNIYLPMLVLVFGALFWLFVVLFLSAKRALRWALGVTFFLLLRFLSLGSLFNGGLIFGILLAIEYYLTKTEPKERLTDGQDHAGQGLHFN